MNRKSTFRIGCFLLFSALLACSGCGLSKPYPAKQLYALNVGVPRRASTAADSSGKVLRVHRVRVTEPFSKRSFQYLVGPVRYEEDYYANFVREPDRLITAQLIDWLTATGDYAAVVNATSPVKTNYSLQCLVTDLYRDQTDAASQNAVVGVRVFLLDESDVDAHVLFTRDYHEIEPLDGLGADELVRAWSDAMRRIFEALTADLRSAG